MPTSCSRESSVEPKTFERLRHIIERESGIMLSEEKHPLLQNRLGRRLRKLGLGNEEDYLHIVESKDGRDELVELIDCISTNVTYFWREKAHFEFLFKVLEGYRLAGKPGMKVWCSASSSGEEPYSIAMCMAEGFPQGDNLVLGTDICVRVLKQAVDGVYDHKQLRDVPFEYRRRYFESRGSDTVEIVPELRRLTAFRRLNLAHFPYPLKGPVDMIFCRNVMIYFSLELRRKLVHEFHRLLVPGGYLIVGHSESLLGIDHPLRTIRSGIYQK
jgi:chemotaxis protein methyltransferase CheR